MDTILHQSLWYCQKSIPSEIIDSELLRYKIHILFLSGGKLFKPRSLQSMLLLSMMSAFLILMLTSVAKLCDYMFMTYELFKPFKCLP